MDINLEEIIKKVALKHNISFTEADRIYKYPFKVLLNNMKKIDFNNPDTLNINMFINEFGKFYVNHNKLRHTMLKLKK